MTKKQKTNAGDRAFTNEFEYSHDNPYHNRLEDFNEFVLRDTEGESFQGKWNKDVFKRDGELAVEIGSGYGQFMIEYTQQYKNVNFIGIDHRFKRSFTLAKKLATLENKSFRYLRARGERLSHLFNENELDKVFYFFPDPWPKARHNKKRLFQETFLNMAHNVLKNKGQILIKTDHDEYFDWMVDVAQKDNRFNCLFKSYDLREENPEHFLASFITKFERIFLDKGIKIKAMVLENQKG
jgi:tRNA (guanine-N7-)-methyltransferase